MHVPPRLLLLHGQHLINYAVLFSVAFLEDGKVSGKVADGFNAVVVLEMLADC